MRNGPPIKTFRAVWPAGGIAPAAGYRVACRNVAEVGEAEVPSAEGRVDRGATVATLEAPLYGCGPADRNDETAGRPAPRLASPRR